MSDSDVSALAAPQAVLHSSPLDADGFADLVAAKVLLEIQRGWGADMTQPRQPGIWVKTWKALKGKKTIIFGLLLPVLPIVLDSLDSTDWTTLGLSPLAGAVIGIIIIALRAGTNTPIGRSEPTATELSNKPPGVP